MIALFIASCANGPLVTPASDEYTLYARGLSTVMLVSCLTVIPQ